MNEIQSHGFILETNAPHVFMVFSYLVIITFHPDTKVALVITQFIWLGMITQACQFHQETSCVVSQINQDKGTVRRFMPMMFSQSQSLLVKIYAFFNIGNIDIEMVETSFYFHSSFH